MKRPKHLFFLVALGLLFPQAMKAQSSATTAREALLDSILSNNTSLAALRAQTSAGKAEARTDLQLPDPEVEAGYLWGTPKGTPARKDFGISQEIDWGVVTGKRRQLARAADRMLDADYALQVTNLLAEADAEIVNATHLNRLCRQLALRRDLSQTLLLLYDKKMAQGDADQLTYNKAKLSHTLAAAALAKAETERAETMERLRRLNGGHPVAYTDTLYDATPVPTLPTLLERAASAQAATLVASAKVNCQKREAKLARMEALPKLSVGFTGEYIAGENHSGVSVGLSLPIWGNARQRVRQSQAALTAAQLELADVETQLKATVEQRYATMLRCQQTAERLKREMEGNDNVHLLQRALQTGQISMTDYLLELSFFNEAQTALLEAERDAALAKSQLMRMF